MKKLVFLAVLLTAMPLGLMAQDDLYFTPKKSDAKNEERSANAKCQNRQTYYCGSNRDVDEYNRRGRVSSYYQKIGSDSLGNDIIQFHAGNGQYPDSLVLDTIYPGSEQYYSYDGSDDDDFAYSRRMNRFDNAYGWYDPWFYDDLTWDYPYYGWSPYWRFGWGWGDPWYAGYYGWRGYYDPWYYGYYGWGSPWYGWGSYWWPGYAWGGSYANPQRGRQFGSGSYGSGRQFGQGTRAAGSSFGNTTGRPGNRSFGSGTRAFGSSSRGFGKTTAGSTRSFGDNGTRSYGYNRNYSNNNYNAPTRTYSAPRSNSSSSSFGGSRSFGGGSFGGGHSFGGGSVGGGRSFGGRR